MRTMYRTDETNYMYYVDETTDMGGEKYFAVIIPAPAQKIRRSCGKWANSKIIDEVIADFGLTEDSRKYKENGETVVFGY